MTDPHYQQLTEHTGVYLPHPNSALVQPAVGLIFDDTQTILVDAGNSPSHAAQVDAAIKAVGLPSVSQILYTHFHWDHIFGAMHWKVPVIAHAECAKRVHEYALRPWGPDYIQQCIAEKPKLRTAYGRIAALIEDWAQFEIVQPSIAFDTPTYRIALNGVTIEMELVGGNHTDDSTVVRVLEEKVLFLADACYPPPASAPKPGLSYHTGLLTRFEAEAMDFYIDGHTGVFSLEEYQQVVAQIIGHR